LEPLSDIYSGNPAATLATLPYVIVDDLGDIYVHLRRHSQVQGIWRSDASGCWILLGQEAQNNINSTSGKIEQEQISVCDSDQPSDVTVVDSETR